MKPFIFIRKKIISFLILLFIVFLVLFSNSAFIATKKGINLWANNVVPSIFPFLIAVDLLKQTNVIYFLSTYLDRFMRPLFNLPGIASFPFVMGFLSGYPVGAKIVSDLYSNAAFTKEEAERMLPLTNNSGPLFIVGTVGISFYSNTLIGIILLITHILSSITIGVINGLFSRLKIINTYSNRSPIKLNKDNSISELGEILSNSIMNSIKTILLIGGFVTLFSVVIAILEKTKIIIFFSRLISSTIHCNSNIVNALLSGIIEFTNGLSKLSTIHLKSISINIILSSIIIGFGGVSVTLQVSSIICKHHLSIKKYILSKIFQALVASFYTFLLLKIPFFNFDLQ